MAQQNRIGSHKTYVRSDGNAIIVRYHYTDVVKFTPKTITLNTGGWETSTTKTRMNQASRQYGLGYTVYQKDYDWFVRYKGKTMKFKGNKISFRR
jgi:hypothetical protein